MRSKFGSLNPSTIFEFLGYHFSEVFEQIVEASTQILYFIRVLYPMKVSKNFDDDKRLLYIDISNKVLSFSNVLWDMTLCAEK